MNKLLSGSWVCYNQCWGNKSTSDATSIPVILNHRAAAFILKRSQIKCSDVKQPCDATISKEDVHALFGEFPASWSCDCFEVSGLSSKLKLPVFPDFEEISQWMAAVDDNDSPVEKGDSFVGESAKALKDKLTEPSSVSDKSKGMPEAAPTISSEVCQDDFISVGVSNSHDSNMVAECSSLVEKVDSFLLITDENSPSIDKSVKASEDKLTETSSVSDKSKGMPEASPTISSEVRQDDFIYVGVSSSHDSNMVAESSSLVEKVDSVSSIADENSPSIDKSFKVSEDKLTETSSFSNKLKGMPEAEPNLSLEVSQNDFVSVGVSASHDSNMVTECSSMIIDDSPPTCVSQVHVDTLTESSTGHMIQQTYATDSMSSILLNGQSFNNSMLIGSDSYVYVDDTFQESMNSELHLEEAEGSGCFTKIHMEETVTADVPFNVSNGPEIEGHSVTEEKYSFHGDVVLLEIGKIDQSTVQSSSSVLEDDDDDIMFNAIDVFTQDISVATARKCKRRRISRKLIEDETSFYSEDSYASLGESRRQILSKDVCVPISSTITTHLAYKKQVISIAERNIQSSVDPQSPTARQTPSIIEANMVLQKKSDQLREMIAKLKKEATFSKSSNSVIQSISRKYNPSTVHGRTRGMYSGTSPYQLYLPPGCESVPDSWFQYAPFKGVVVYRAGDTRCREVASMINRLSTMKPVDQIKEAKDAVLKLIKQKMSGRQFEQSTDVWKPTRSKLFKTAMHIPLQNRFAQYAKQVGATSATNRREQLRNGEMDMESLHGSSIAKMNSKETITTFVQPSRVYFNLNTVKSWRENTNGSQTPLDENM